jgi:predicted alpha/beta-fold hydrolase
MPPFSAPPFRCHPLWRHGHLQTIVTTLVPRRIGTQSWRSAAIPREFELADGDRLTAALHIHADDPGRTKPLVILLHGLEGDVDSHYVRGMSAKAHALGFHSLRLNYRGCGGSDALSRKLYNGDLIGDIDTVVRTMAAEAAWPIVVVGVSLGANKILRLFADYGDNPPPGLLGGVAISPPIDFLMTNVAFRQGFNWVYDKYFLRKLKVKLQRRQALYGHDTGISQRVKNGLATNWLRDFDEAVTAPEGGFANAHEYYSRAGVGDGLVAIRIPTLIIHAKDDPLIPMEVFDSRAALIASNPALTTIFTDRGGHVGFLEHPSMIPPEPWMDHYWAENQAIAFTRHLVGSPGLV